MKIGKWVRTQRLARGWSQAELARRLRVVSGGGRNIAREVGGIGRWERDDCLPHLGVFRQLCVLFACSADVPLRLKPKRKTARTQQHSSPPPAMRDDDEAEAATA